MKNMKYMALLVAAAVPLFAAGTQEQTVSDNTPNSTAQPAASANLSPAATEVVRLASGGVGDDVVLAYIQNSQSAFNLGADDVLYLRDVGLSSPVITAMLNHDTTLRNQTPSNPNPVRTAPVQEPPPPDVEPSPVYTSTPPT